MWLGHIFSVAWSQFRRQIFLLLGGTRRPGHPPCHLWFYWIVCLHFVQQTRRPSKVRIFAIRILQNEVTSRCFIHWSLFMPKKTILNNSVIRITMFCWFMVPQILTRSESKVYWNLTGRVSSSFVVSQVVSTSEIRYALKKKNDIFWEFFPKWVGVVWKGFPYPLQPIP